MRRCACSLSRSAHRAAPYCEIGVFNFSPYAQLTTKLQIKFGQKAEIECCAYGDHKIGTKIHMLIKSSSVKLHKVQNS